MPKCLWSRVTAIIPPAIHPHDAQHMVRNTQSAECKISHFRDVCRSVRNRAVHNLEQETEQYQEEEHHFDTVNTNSIKFDSKNSVTAANLKTLSNQIRILVPYCVDSGSDRSIMLLHLYKTISKGNKKQLVVTRNKNIQSKIYNRTTVKIIWYV